jgi:hypothetical protein
MPNLFILTSYYWVCSPYFSLDFALASKGPVFSLYIWLVTLSSFCCTICTYIICGSNPSIYNSNLIVTKPIKKSFVIVLVSTINCFLKNAEKRELAGLLGLVYITCRSHVQDHMHAWSGDQLMSSSSSPDRRALNLT